MKCGFAKRDITPAAGVFLAGNGEFQSTGINDPLFIRAVVLENEGVWTALISADLIGIELETVRSIRSRLSKLDTGKPEHIFISCTHTHNGPHTRFNRKTAEKHRDSKYLERLAIQAVEAIAEADKKKETASITYARGYAFENMNRRIITPDGKAHFYNPRLLREQPEIADRISGIADTELDALQFYRNDGSVILTAVHYAAHPLTLGIYSHVISADYPGPLVDKLEAKYNAPAVFFQGACGDLHPRGLFAGFERMRDMGGKLADEAIRVLSARTYREYDIELRVMRADLKLPVDCVRQHSNTWTDLFGAYYEAEMGAVVLGQIAFVTAPGEITGAAGLQIKWNSPFIQTWVLYNTNCYAGYICPKRYYIEGGYEGDSAQCLHPDACDVVIKTSRKFLELS